jgi:hypothetical protein
MHVCVSLKTHCPSGLLDRLQSSHPVKQQRGATSLRCAVLGEQGLLKCTVDGHFPSDAFSSLLPKQAASAQPAFVHVCLLVMKGTGSAAV